MSRIWDLRTDYVLNEERARRRRIAIVQLVLALGALAGTICMFVQAGLR